MEPENETHMLSSASNVVINPTAGALSNIKLRDFHAMRSQQSGRLSTRTSGGHSSASPDATVDQRFPSGRLSLVKAGNSPHPRFEAH